MVFTDDGEWPQTILCAKDQETCEVPGETHVEGLLHLMAAYYVFGVEYPKACRALLYFVQDIFMTRMSWSKTSQLVISLLLVGFIRELVDSRM